MAPAVMHDLQQVSVSGKKAAVSSDSGALAVAGLVSGKCQRFANIQY
jgi:hypothetical protein